NLDWLSTTFATGGETGELQLPRAAAVHAQAYLALMEGAMVVGRGLGTGGTASAALTPAALAAAYLEPLASAPAAA
ncbi:MAG: hypothetical protein SV108_04800, partial [Pseudomonadota bacterium]|nr:hypothetical protein [Pseudomonadota bacterium]